MGAKDASDEECVARVDGASQAYGGFDPGLESALRVANAVIRPTWWPSCHVEAS